MISLAPLLLGALLVLVGGILVVLVFVLMRIVPRVPPEEVTPLSLQMDTGLVAPEDAVLLVRPGGQVVYLNEQAREWFGVQEEPNLERMARQTRPTEYFLSLCAAPGQTRLTVGTRLVEGMSYRVPVNGQQAMMVVLHPPEVAFLEEDRGVSGRVLNIFSELAQSMTASLDLQDTLEAVMESVEKLIPCDFFEITLWDEASQSLVPYRYVGMLGAERTLTRAEDRYTVEDGYSGYLIRTRGPLLIHDVDARRDVRPKLSREDYPFRSYLGVPLVLEDQLIGTLELGGLEVGAFNERDQALLTMLARQAAVAIRNAQIHRQEQRRAKEMTGLARLAQAAAVLRDPEDLYVRLMEGIAPLFDAEVVGFWIYNEVEHVLEAQRPFQGVPEHVLPLFRLPLEPGTEAEAIWLTEDLIFSRDAGSDERLITLGLAPLTQAAGIHQTVLVRLTAAGEPLGYLMVANPRDGVLGPDEQRLAAIIAGQVGPIIENARLLRQSRLRTQRSEMLRRIASLVASSATLDEILHFSLLELARLMRAEVGVLLLYSPERGVFDVHEPSLFGLRAEDFLGGTQIPIDDAQFALTVTATRRPFISDRAAQDRRILPAFRPLVRHLGLQSLISLPLISRDVGVGELVLATREPAQFSVDELQLAGTAASLIAPAIERERLFAQTDQSLRRRVEQLGSLARLSRELSATLDLQAALERIYQQALALTESDCGTILLLDQTEEAGQLLGVRHFWGENPGDALHPLEAEALQQERPLVVRDFSRSEFAPRHEEVRSALVMPVRYRQQTLGLLHLHSHEPDHFQSEQVEIVQVLAAQAGTAIYSALQYQEAVRLNQKLQRRAETLTQLLFTAQGLTEATSLQVLLDRVAHAIHDATPFDMVLVSLYDPESGQLERMAEAGLPADVWQALQARTQPWDQVQQLLRPEFEHRGVFFLPHEKRPVLSPEVHAVTVLPGDGESNGLYWHPEDLLLIPLYSSEGEPLGLISVDAPRDGLRPDQATLESLRLLADHAALMIQNRRTMQQLVERAAQLEERVQRAEEGLQQMQERLSALQEKNRQQAEALDHLQRLSERVRAVLNIASRVNRQPDRARALQTLALQLLDPLGFESVLLVEPFEGVPRLTFAGGGAAEVSLEALIGQRNPMLTALQNAEPLLEADRTLDSPWADSPLLNRLGARAFVCLPILSREQETVEAVLLATRRTPLSFDEEEADLYRLLSEQVAIALQNLALAEQTQRRLREVNLLLEFTRRINRLDPDAILNTLLESAYQVILGAQTGFIAVWDANAQALVPRLSQGVTDPESLRGIRLPLESLPGRVFQQGEPLRVAEVDFAHDYPLNAEDLVRYQQAFAGRLPLSSLLVPLRIGEEVQGVVVLDSLRDVDAFGKDDQALLESLIDQSALMLEKVRLLHASEQRALQLQSLTDAAATLGASLEFDALVGTLLDVLVPVLPYDTATLWLREGERFTIRAARGFALQEDPTNLSIAVEDSRILQDMLTTAEPLYVPDMRADPRFPGAEARERLSWLGIPLISQGELVGVIAVEKREANAYGPDLRQLAATFGSQASIALENARLFAESRRRAEELDRRTRRLALLHRLSMALIGSLDLTHILRTASEELAQALPGHAVSAVVFDPDIRHPQLVVEVPQVHEALPLDLPEAPFFADMVERLGAFQTAVALDEESLSPLRDFLQAMKTQALLALPLTTGEELHGVLLVHHAEAHRYSAAEIELGITIANQTAVSLQNARLYMETRRLTDTLEQRVVERTEELALEHQRTETLLRLITEASASLDLDHVLDRTLMVLNEATGAEQSNIMLKRPGEETLYYRAAFGMGAGAPVGGRPSAIRANESLAGWVIEHRRALLIEDLRLDPRWTAPGDEPSRHRRSAVAVPLTLGAEVLGALLLFHSQPGFFSAHQVDLVQAAANQIAVVINNAELFKLIRDQSEHLGALMRDFQVEASRSRAILEAVADGVLVTDSKGRITLFNESAERILGLKREEVLDKSLDNFVGLFGNAARDWMETIRMWSQDPDTYRPGDVYAEQITLDDGRVVAVHLSLVKHRREFLGTVSIFRDITHQVELDRMKSEFVANVSHELRTPMTSIKGYVDILLMGAAGPLNEQQNQFLRVVKSNTERLNVLVQDLLDISRYESGQITLSVQPLDLRALADEVVREIERLAEKENRPMTFRVESEPDLPSVPGDSERVRQILYNLVDNAYHYTPEGGQVTVRIHRREDEVQVDVSDTGIGIPPDEQERVFDRFYRGENPLVMATPGTGLGLSITRYLVEMHGGRIWLSSEGVPGRGSTFSFTLPLQPAAQESEQE